jgi:hypothetical protein
MSKLLINEYPLMVLPSLAVRIGLNEAIFIQQLHYWLEKAGTEKQGRKWVYNTYQDWEKQFPFWSNATLRRIDYEKLDNIPSAQNEQMDVVKMSKPITRDYTENTDAVLYRIVGEGKHACPMPYEMNVLPKNYYK